MTSIFVYLEIKMKSQIFLQPAKLGIVCIIFIQRVDSIASMSVGNAARKETRRTCGGGYQHDVPIDSVVGPNLLRKEGTFGGRKKCIQESCDSNDICFFKTSIRLADR